MLLPGGLLRRGARARDARLNPPTGHLELALADAASMQPLTARHPALPSNQAPADDFVGRVSAVLMAALHEVDGERASPALVDELCVADRQFLMLAVARLVGHERTWKTAACDTCTEVLDIPVDLAVWPVREAGEGFPFAVVNSSLGRLAVRTPNGADQAAISRVADPREAERALLARCMSNDVDVHKLTADDFTAIDAALEDVSPALAVRLSASCPACGASQTLRLDPYFVMHERHGRTLDAVHTIASHYHWGEETILALPLSRREEYLARIDRARGSAS